MLVANETLLGPVPPGSAYAEGYRILRASVLALSEKEPFRTALITSPGQREGKTTVTLNLGTMLALADRSCVLIDCDFYGAALTGVLGLDGRPGLTDTCLGSGDLSAAVVSTELPHLRVLPAGTALDQGAELIATGAVGGVLATLKEDAEFVLCDCTPINGFGTALSLAREVDVVFAVVLARSPVLEVQRSLSLLEDMGGKIAGVVVNDVLPGDSAVYRSFHRYYRTR